MTTAQSSNISIDHLLQTLCSFPIGLNLPSPYGILLNCTDYRPRQPSIPINLEQVRDYLITKNLAQKHHYDQRHNARPLPDLSPRQDILFLSPIEQTSYLEGTIISCANTPRSYIIKAEGHRYSHNRQHIRPINTDPPSPFARPSTYAALQSHINLTISGPSQPPTDPKVIWNMKMPTSNSTPNQPFNKLCKTTHHSCPYTRPHSAKPSNSPYTPISGPSP